MKINLIILSGVLLTACTTGNNYPQQYAKAFCNSLFSCVDMDDSLNEILYPYDNKEECLFEVEKSKRESSTFDAFEEGDVPFNSESADLCLTEIEEVVSDSDCDGNMDALSFSIDISNDECDNVYE